MTNDRRRLVYQIQRDTFIEVLNGNAKFDLPPDAVIMNIRMAWDTDSVDLLVRSAGFGEVPEGAIAPTRFLEATAIH